MENMLEKIREMELLVDGIMCEMDNGQEHQRMSSHLSPLVRNFTCVLMDIVETGEIDPSELDGFAWNTWNLEEDLFSNWKAFLFLQYIDKLPTAFQIIANNADALNTVLTEELEYLDNAECWAKLGQGHFEWRMDLSKLHERANGYALEMLSTYIPKVLGEHYKGL